MFKYTDDLITQNTVHCPASFSHALRSGVVFDFCSCLWLLRVRVGEWKWLCEYVLFWNLSLLFYTLTVCCEDEESEGVFENVPFDVKGFTPLLMLNVNLFVL